MKIVLRYISSAFAKRYNELVAEGEGVKSGGFNTPASVVKAIV